MAKFKLLVIGIDKYILGLTIPIVFINTILEGMSKGANQILMFILLFITPLILVINASLIKGIENLILALLIINYLIPTFNLSNGSSIPEVSKYINSINYKMYNNG